MMGTGTRLWLCKVSGPHVRGATAIGGVFCMKVWIP
jgi:hypothetical protein